MAIVSCDKQFAHIGAQVIVLDKLTYAGNLDSLQDVWKHPSFCFVRGDINDCSLLSKVLDFFEPDTVVNFAAESHVDRSIDGPREFLETNVVGTFTLLSAALHYYDGLDRDARSTFRFLHVSTDEVYGSLGATGKFTEETRYAPNSPYSASKAAADHFVRAYYETYGLPVLTTNCSNNYGPFQFPEKLIPLIILNALEGKALPVYGDGGNVRDWLYVQDHCRAISKIIEAGQPGETYNIGGNCERSNLEVVRSICAIVDELCPDLPHSPCESLITFVQDRPGHDRRYAIDCSKLTRELGWSPTVAFEEGLRSTVRWYIENQGWIARVNSGDYRRERLGISRTTA